MRTAVLFGLLMIADAINAEVWDEVTITFTAILLIVLMIMDVISFINDLTKK